MVEYEHSVSESWWNLRHAAGLATRYSEVADRLGTRITGMVVPIVDVGDKDTEVSVWAPVQSSLLEGLPFQGLSNEASATTEVSGHGLSWAGITLARRGLMRKILTLPPDEFTVVAAPTGAIPLSPARQATINESIYRGMGHRKREALLEATTEVKEVALNQFKLQRQMLKTIRTQRLKRR